MSRVHDALKRANAMQSTAKTGGVSEGAVSEGIGNGAERENSQEISAPPDLPQPARSFFRGLLRYRLIKRLMRRFGLSPNLPVPRCQGITRLDQPCRGPAMANGFCRMHGGARHTTVVEKTRELVDRVLTTR